jgi:cell division protein FtsX
LPEVLATQTRNYVYRAQLRNVRRIKIELKATTVLVLAVTALIVTGVAIKTRNATAASPEKAAVIEIAVVIQTRICTSRRKRGPTVVKMTTVTIQAVEENEDIDQCHRRRLQTSKRIKCLEFFVIIME